jgi:SAM-dependent methyltransferase
LTFLLFLNRVSYELAIILIEINGTKAMASQVKSKQRVAQFGEVLTGKEIVNDMLDLVKQETERIDSRFLEPACGTGNFLTEILARKLHVVETRYKKIQLEYERYAILAVSSLYGIDLLEDNVQECRQRLFNIFDDAYTKQYGLNAKDKCRLAVQYILKRNIVHGDALSLKTVGENPQPIIFSEWSLANGSMIKRRDFAFRELVHHASLKELPLFSDQGEEVFIPSPVKDYPLVHFLEVSNAYEE